MVIDPYIPLERIQFKFAVNGFAISPHPLYSVLVGILFNPGKRV
jgi:hypothetical protein